MALCRVCQDKSRTISRGLGICLSCIRNRPEAALTIAMASHHRSRQRFGLPQEPPRDPHGLPCTLCANLCRIPQGAVGYCGLRENVDGRLRGSSAERGKLSWYHDPLPTNCVADWVCPAGTGSGYPAYANTEGAEYGYKNLAVFFHGCSFNCLFCQNWQFRRYSLAPARVRVDDLVADVDEDTSCICYFGGDPGPQLPFALRASRLALERHGQRILRICWETNGSMHPALLDEMIELSLQSGGCIKFDLKAWDDNLHRALTGVSNERTFRNFTRAAVKRRHRSAPPLLVASTLLVPGYLDVAEIRGLAGFIAAIDPEIPYSLLAYYPHFEMPDLPRTPRAFANTCLDAAREAGLRHVRLGNVHLLS